MNGREAYKSWIANLKSYPLSLTLSHKGRGRRKKGICGVHSAPRNHSTIYITPFVVVRSRTDFLFAHRSSVCSLLFRSYTALPFAHYSPCPISPLFLHRSFVLAPLHRFRNAPPFPHHCLYSVDYGPLTVDIDYQSLIDYNSQYFFFACVARGTNLPVHSSIIGHVSIIGHMCIIWCKS